MAADSLEIANMALSHIGAKVTLAAFPTAASTGIINEAIFLWYSKSRRRALSFYDWSFARKRVALTAHADDPTDGIWTYRYVYPSDALKIRRIQNVPNLDADSVGYDVEIAPTALDLSIQTNLEDAIAIYTFDQTTTTVYSEGFDEALSHLLAANIAYPITRKRSLKGDHLNLYRSLRQEAAAADANQRIEEEPPRDADWIRGR
jgi:hypothetical protein